MGISLVVVALGGVGCDELRPGKRRGLYTPWGWDLVKGRSQMLARSYPDDSWLTLLVRVPKRASRLFAMPIPTAPRAQTTGRRQPMLPFLARSSSKKQNKKQKAFLGWRLYLRSTHALTLQLRVKTSDTLGNPVQYTQKLRVLASSRKWSKHIILFSSFRAKGRKRALNARRLRGKIAVWSTRHNIPQGSVTLTIKGPLPYLANNKARKRAAKASTRPTSRASIRPTSRPVRRPSSRPSAHPSSRKTLH